MPRAALMADAFVNRSSSAVFAALLAAGFFALSSADMAGS